MNLWRANTDLNDDCSANPSFNGRTRGHQVDHGKILGRSVSKDHGNVMGGNIAKSVGTLLIIKGDDRPCTEQVVFWVRFPVSAGFTTGQSTAKIIWGFDPLLS